MAYTQPSDIANTIETRVSEIVTETLIQESVMIANSQDRSAEVGAGMNQLDIPLLNSLALQNVPTDGTEMTAGTIQSQVASLVLDQHKSYAFAIGDKVQVQSKLNLIQEQVTNGSRVHAAAIDDYLLGLLTGAVSQSAPDHLIALDGSDALVDIRATKKLLDEANVPMQDRCFVASAGFMEKLFSSNNIIRANEYGASDGIRSGQVANIYGFKMVESQSSEIPEDGFVAYHRPTIAFARQITPKFERERRVLKQSDEFALTQLYGGIVTDPSGVRIVVGDADGTAPIA